MTITTGDVLVEQGVVAPALFVLASGVLAASQAQGDRQIDVMRLAPGDFFGQASVLNGAVTAFKVSALTRGTLYAIGREDIAPILKERPAVATEPGQIMVRREAAGKACLDETAPGESQTATFSTRVAERVKQLFGIV